MKPIFKERLERIGFKMCKEEILARLFYGLKQARVTVCGHGHNLPTRAKKSAKPDGRRYPSYAGYALASDRRRVCFKKQEDLCRN